MKAHPLFFSDSQSCSACALAFASDFVGFKCWLKVTNNSTYCSSLIVKACRRSDLSRLKRRTKGSSLFAAAPLNFAESSCASLNIWIALHHFDIAIVICGCLLTLTLFAIAAAVAIERSHCFVGSKNVEFVRVMRTPWFRATTTSWRISFNFALPDFALPDFALMLLKWSL
jgi:hypothetical protein